MSEISNLHKDISNLHSLDSLCGLLKESSNRQNEEDWPGEQLEHCANSEVFRWFIPETWGGLDFNDEQLVRGYAKLSAACLKTTFVITQRTAACKRLILCENDNLKSKWLPGLATGKHFSTVGISHLTTSRRHVNKPVLQARHDAGRFVVNGFSPWVTGGSAADMIVMGAELEDGKQILFAAEKDQPGLNVQAHQSLVGLTGSQTGSVVCNELLVAPDNILRGPIESVLTTNRGTATGGLQTSTLALGLANAAIEFVEQESQKRSDLSDQAKRLSEQGQLIFDELISFARGEAARSKEEIRKDANSLVLRATQSALIAAKGSGYVQGHPVGRWCKEALFFLVWSCPQPVLAANLCELAKGAQESSSL